MQCLSDPFDPAVVESPYSFYDELRRTAPVHRVPGTDFFLVSTWDAVREAVSRADDFSSNLTAALVHPRGEAGVFDLTGDAPAWHVLATGDDPAHIEERRLILPALAARRIRELESTITALVGQLWTASASDGRIEWMSAMGDRLPMTLVTKLIGLPGADVPRLVEMGYGSTELLGGLVPEERQEAAVAAMVELSGYLYEAFDRALADPGDNLMGDLARAVASGRIAQTAAVLMLVQLVGAGGESTAGLIGNAARLLSERDDLQRAVRADPELLVPFLEETLRLESPFRAHHRHVAADTSLAGVDLPAGSHLLLLWGSANRDPAAFDDADQLRWDRPSPRAHLAFGHGVHFCVGAALARLEARIALRTLLDNTEWFRATDAQWLPSVFVRRHRRLELQFIGSS